MSPARVVGRAFSASSSSAQLFAAANQPSSQVSALRASPFVGGGHQGCTGEAVVSMLCPPQLKGSAPSLWAESLAFRTHFPAHKSLPLDSELNLHPTHILFHLEAQKDIV